MSLYYSSRHTILTHGIKQRQVPLATLIALKWYVDGTIDIRLTSSFGCILFKLFGESTMIQKRYNSAYWSHSFFLNSKISVLLIIWTSISVKWNPIATFFFFC